MRPSTKRPSRFFVPGRVGCRAELAAQARPYDLFFGSYRHGAEDGPMGHDRPGTIDLGGGGETHRRRWQRSMPRAGRGWLLAPLCGRAGGWCAPSGVRRRQAGTGNRDRSSGPMAEAALATATGASAPTAANVGGGGGRLHLKFGGRSLGENYGFGAICLRWEIFIGSPIGPAKIRLCLGPALWAGVVAQALSTYRVRPALSTIDRA
jgi:hypothetical protein